MPLQLRTGAGGAGVSVHSAAKEHVGIATDILRTGKIGVEEFLDWHGLSALYDHGRMPFGSFRLMPLAGQWLSHFFCGPGSSEYRPVAIRRLEELGKALVKRSLPWATTISEHVTVWDWPPRDELDKENKECDVPGEAMFGAFCVLAVNTEIFGKKGAGKDVANVFNRGLGGLKRSKYGRRMALLLNARNCVRLEAAERVLEQFRFDEQEKDLVRQWLKGTVSFTGRQ